MNKLLFIISFLCSSVVFANDIDYLELANVLIKDKNYTRAKRTLIKAEVQLEQIDKEHFYLLKGLLSLREGDKEQAISYLNKVSDAYYLSRKNIYLADTYYQLKNFKKAMGLYSKLDEEDKEKFSVQYLFSEIAFELGQYNMVFKLINAVTDRHKRQLMHVVFLMRMKLYQEAYLYGLENAKSENDYTKLAKLFLGHKEYKLAVLVLEEGSIKFNSCELTSLLASAYDLQKMHFSASQIFVKLAYIDPEESFNAGEYLRKYGQNKLAQVMNLNVSDLEQKLSQKINLLIQEDKFDQIVGLYKPMEAFRVLNNPLDQYAMAYSQLMVGNYDTSVKLLKRVKSEKLQAKVGQLLEVAIECKAKSWECHGL